MDEEILDFTFTYTDGPVPFTDSIKLTASQRALLTDDEFEYCKRDRLWKWVLTLSAYQEETSEEVE